MINLHAERVTGDDRVVRWVMPAGTLPAGRVRCAPGRLGEMLSAGMLSGALVEHTAVWLWLQEGQTWSAEGATVQTALRQALADPQGWVIDPAPGEVLQRVIADLLTGSVGDFVRSHGGSVESHRDGDDVEVRLGGACEHCPAAEYTLRLRLLDAVRRRCPEALVSDRGPGTLRLSLTEM